MNGGPAAVAAGGGGRAWVLAPAERVTELYRAHLPGATRLAYLLTGDRTAAEDVAQEAFLRVASRLGALRDERAFGAYLHPWRVQPHHGPRRHGLAGSGLAEQRYQFAACDVEIDVHGRGGGSAAGGKSDGQSAD